MTDQLESLSEQVGHSKARAKDPGNPPLHLWQPELSGDIDILIKADGQWIHEGRPIQRQTLVNLFASILRREEDGEYYLVTPVEKWRLQVEALPLVITDVEAAEEVGQQTLSVTTNTGRQYQVGEQHPLFLPELESFNDVPAVSLPHGLAALFSRTAWYRLVELAEERAGVTGVVSSGEFYPLT